MIRNKIRYLLAILITICLLLIVAAIGYLTFIGSFNIFDKPQKIVTKSECDYEGLRKAVKYKYFGNAVTNPSLIIAIENCLEYNSLKDNKILFIADLNNSYEDGVDFEWLSFDSLEVQYNENIRVHTKKNLIVFPDSSLNVTVVYKIFKNNK